MLNQLGSRTAVGSWSGTRWGRILFISALFARHWADLRGSMHKRGSTRRGGPDAAQRSREMVAAKVVSAGSRCSLSDTRRSFCSGLLGTYHSSVIVITQDRKKNIAMLEEDCKYCLLVASTMRETICLP
ncbi:hypothetical protein F5Y10DRAFT_138162 [Nemania abortiva]|nr:hypothetical protein F5Y10DRAFT_138162 [Nemania abortiva]